MKKRQHFAVTRPVRGTDPKWSQDRKQMALRPKSDVFSAIARLAEAWGVSWNEAALRLIDKGLAAR